MSTIFIQIYTYSIGVCSDAIKEKLLNLYFFFHC